MLSLSTALVACVDQAATTSESPDDLDTPQSCPVKGTQIPRSLIVTIDQTGPEASLDAAGVQLLQSKFTFTRALSQILATSGADPSETGKTLFQQWMSTFGPTDCTNPKVDPNHYGEVCPRNPEFQLASVDPTDPNSTTQFNLVALTNRFDLAPKSGATCGEYRMVFAMKSTKLLGRGFIIFEGALPNPGTGIAGCLPVAEFWQKLSKDDDETDRIGKLEQFYFTGGAIKNVPPVVDAHHYGLLTNGAYTAGQIRTNMFISDAQWNLREFKTDTTCVGGACTLALDHVTVAVNPANELFEGSAAKSAQFLKAFPKQVKALATDDVSTIGMTIADQYNEYESVSQLTDVLYDRFTDSALTAAIGSAAQADGVTLTVPQLLRRASTQTCAGCHEQSTIGSGSGDGSGENQLGGGLVWPKSLGFVQIDETGNTSPALQDAFLPHRADVLDDFIDSLCGGSGAIVDDGLTIGGGAVGAAN